MALTPIDKFEVMYSANTFPPRIWLLSGTNFIGQLIFMPNGTALPQDAMVNGQVNLYYHLEDFENVMELWLASANKADCMLSFKKYLYRLSAATELILYM
jgi:hypothetical protein